MPAKAGIQCLLIPDVSKEAGFPLEFILSLTKGGIDVNDNHEQRDFSSTALVYWRFPLPPLIFLVVSVILVVNLCDLG